MQVEILTIGDELLIGQTVNTNASWLGEQMNLAGIRVHRSLTISDSREEIIRAFDEALGRSELVLVTGGLGPTKDDITKKTLCEYFNTDLVLDEPTLERIKGFFERRRLPLLETNRLQAMVPRNCEVIANLWGTANGMWFNKSGHVLVSMPGVPYEMKSMMTEAVLPKVLGFFQRPAIVHRTVLTAGIGESFLAEKIEGWENSLAEEGIHLAYLPSPGMVKLRMSCYGGGEERDIRMKIAGKEAELIGLVGEYVYGFDEDTLASVVGSSLLRRRMSLGVAESCTGGYLGHLLTSVPGSSEYFTGGVIAYTNTIKHHQLGVSGEWLETAGAVNEETAVQMAIGVREKLNTTFALSTTGIAGPGGGTEHNPVGTVWIGFSGPGGSYARMFRYGHSRERNIQMAAQSALEILRKELLKIEV